MQYFSAQNLVQQYQIYPQITLTYSSDRPQPLNVPVTFVELALVITQAITSIIRFFPKNRQP